MKQEQILEYKKAIEFATKHYQWDELNQKLFDILQEAFIEWKISNSNF